MPVILQPTDLGEQSATGDGENDDYDIAVRELMFATRGKVGDVPEHSLGKMHVN